MNANGARSLPVVMAIEDCPETRELLVELLAGYRVLAFENGMKALEWLRNHAHEKVDLVLSDFNMPGPNGVETLSEIRKLRPGIKTVLMSATIMDDLQQVVSKHHFSGCLEKPFSSPQIEGLLGRVLNAPDQSGNARGSSA